MSKKKAPKEKAEDLAIEITDDPVDTLDIPDDEGAADDDGDPEEDAAPPATDPDGSPDAEEGDEGADEALATLQKSLKESQEEAARERKRADELENRGRENQNKARIDLLTQEEKVVSAKIESIEEQIKNKVAARKAAREDGSEDDADTIADEIADLRWDLKNETAKKNWLSTNKEKLEKGEDEDAPVRRAEEPTPEAQDWIKRHPRFKMDSYGNPLNAYSARAIAAHHAAILDGIKPGTPEYLEHLDNDMLKHYPDHEMPEGQTQQQTPKDPPKKRQTTAAPTGGSSSGSGGSGKQKYTLTRQQHQEFSEAAELHDMSLQEYLELPEVKAKLKANN
jgi:hypothetical protein